MHTLVYKKPTILKLLFIAVLVGFIGIGFKFQSSVQAATGINEQINYQGRLLTATGAVVPDGTYNMEFEIIQDGDGCNPTSGTPPCGGTVEWTETRTGANKVTVKNGYFSVYLGAVTPFSSSVDWNQDTLWLSVNIGGTGTPSWDGEMEPFNRLSSSPYALNSKALGGLTANDFVKLAQGTQTDASLVSSIFINKTGASGNILELEKNGADVFLLNNTGAVTFQNTVDSTTGFQVLDADGGTPIFNIDTTNERVGIGDASPDALLDVDLAAGNQVLITATAAPTADMFWLTNSGQATTTNGVDGFIVDFVQGADGAADTNAAMSSILTTTANHASDIGIALNATLNNSSTAGTQYAMTINNSDTAGNAVTEGLLVLANSETTASTVTDGLMVMSPGVNNGIVDAIDVSDGNITNAINVGDNNIVGTTAVIDFTNFDVSGAGAVTAVGLNSGSGLIQGTGGATISGGPTEVISLQNTTGASGAKALIIDSAGSSTSSVIQFQVANGGSATLRASSAGNLILSGTSTGAVYLNFDSGTGGVIFSDGAAGTVATVSSAGAADFNSTITAGSGNTVLTLSTGMIDGDALTLIAAADGGTGTSSGSGLAIRSDGVGLLQGCNDGQVLAWVESTDTWDCTTGGGGGANTALSNLSSVAINTSLLPGTDDAIDLGDNTHRFRDLYLGGDTLHIGTSTTDEGTLSYNTTTNVLHIGTDSTTNGDIAFFTDDLYLDKSTGFVGVGDATPNARLEINNVGSDTNPLVINTNGSIGNYTQTNSGIFVKDAAGNEILRIYGSDPDPTFANYNTWNLYIGHEAGLNNPTANTSGSGYANTGIGYDALRANTSGAYNVAVGTKALALNTIGGGGTAVGAYALAANTLGDDNTAFGYSALERNTIGEYNTALGYDALNANISGDNNVATGFYSLVFNETGDSNSAFGYDSLGNTGKRVTAGSFVTGVSYTIQSIGTTDFTLIGAASNTVGLVFTASGAGTGSGTASSNNGNNSAFGYYGLGDLLTGSNNTSIGYNTGLGITTGSNNTILGANVTGLSSSLSNNIIIADGSGNQRINVDNNGNVGIGDQTPSYLLDVDLSAGKQVVFEATAAPTVDMFSITNSGQATTTDGVEGLAITFAQGADGAADSNSGLTVNASTTADHASDALLAGGFVLSNSSTTGSQFVLVAQNADVASPGTTEALILAQDLETTTAKVARGLWVLSSGVNGGIITGVDVSDGNIDNAISVGANIVLGTTATIDFTNFDVSSAGALDVSSTITAGSANTVLTLSTGMIDGDALTLIVAADGGTGTSSGSGLAIRSDGVGLLQGCNDGQVLAWVESTDTWDCTTVSGGSGANTALSNLSAVAINTSLLPASDDAIDLGDNTHRWRDLYLGPATLHIGTSTTDEYALTYDTTNNTLEVQAKVDSVEGFQILDTDGGTPIFNVDTTNERVGIGTATPGQDLNVVTANAWGGIKIQGGTTSSGIGMQFQNNAGYDWEFNVGGSTHSSIANKFTIYDADVGADRLVIDTSGNVSIGGDTSPDAKLDVDAVTTTTAAVAITDTGVHTGTGATSVASIFADSTTTGDVLTVSASALTTGSGLVVSGPTGGTAGSTDSLVKITGDVGNSTAGLLSSTATFDSTAASANGVNLNLLSTNSNSTNANTIKGISNVVIDSVALGNTNYGSQTIVSNDGAISGSVTKVIYGDYTGVSVSGATDTGATVTNAYGQWIRVSATKNTGSNGTVNNYGLYVDDGTSSTAGTSTKYGIYVEPQTGADINVAAYFGSNVGIGDTTPDALFDVDLAAGNQALITATAASTVDMLNISNQGFGTTTDGANGLQIEFSQNGDGAADDSNAGLYIFTQSSADAADNFYSTQIELQNSSTAGTQILLQLTNLDHASNPTTEALARLTNNESTADKVTDYLLLQTESTDTSTDAIDVSDSGFYNAINVGDNRIAGTTAVIDFTNFDVSSTGLIQSTQNGTEQIELHGATSGPILNFGQVSDSDQYMSIGAYNGGNNIDTKGRDLWIYSTADPSGMTYSHSTGNFSVSGQIIASNDGVEFTESDTNPTCGANNYNIFADASEAKLKQCVNGTVSDLGAINKYETFDNTGTYTKPNDASLIIVEAWGGGGGGGGGTGGSNAAVRSGGAGGGGGAFVTGSFLAANVGSTVPVTIGNGGNAGNAGVNGAGTDGGVGGNTCFSTTTACAGTMHLRAYGGGGGNGDGTAGNGGGGGGGSHAVGSTNGTAATGGTGGGPLGAAAGAVNSGGGGGGGATAAATGAAGGAAQFGGAGGGSSSSTGAGNSGNGGTSVRGGAAGGAGGTCAITTCTARNGGAGGKNLSGLSGGGGTAGTAGGAGGAGSAGLGYGGDGGGGGANSSAAAGGAGGVGGIQGGGGGGGGGAHTGSTTGGAGAAGGKGQLRVWTVRGTGADVAEIYGTKETDLIAGDVVCLDPSLRAGVKKCANKYDSTAMGIISTTPGIVIGDVQDTDVHAAPVVLAGRTPIRVSSENGQIEAGDLLTASSTPGIAMKATKAGQIIGQAMAPFHGDGVGMTMAFVKTNFSNGSRASKLFQTADSQIADSQTAVGTELLSYLAQEKDAVAVDDSLSEIITDRVVAGLEIVSPSVVTNDLKVDNLSSANAKDIQINSDVVINGTLKADKIFANQIEGLEILTDRIASRATATGSDTPDDSQVLAATDVQTSSLDSVTITSANITLNLNVAGELMAGGGLKVDGPSEFMGEAIFNGLVSIIGDTTIGGNTTFAGRATFNNDSGGFALIKAGKQEINVVFDKPYTEEPIVTLTNKNGQFIRYAYKDLKTTGFTIVLEEPAATDIEMSWTALSIKSPRISQNP